MGQIFVQTLLIADTHYITRCKIIMPLQTQMGKVQHSELAGKRSCKILEFYVRLQNYIFTLYGSFFCYPSTYTKQSYIFNIAQKFYLPNDWHSSLLRTFGFFVTSP